MAIISQIRTRGKWIMLVMVGLGIFLFLIMSEWSSGASILQGNKSKVAVVNGVSVENAELETKVSENITNFELSKGNRYQATEEERQQIREETWNEMLEKIVLGKVYSKNGIQVTDDEMVEMVRGRFIHPQVQQAFTDPATGQFYPEQVVAFIKSLDKDEPGTEPGTKRRQWTTFENAIKEERFRNKYLALIQKSFYTPSWLRKAMHEEFNKSINGRVISLPYSSIPDSSVKVSNADLKKYLDDHKKLFEQKKEARQVKLVSFAVQPSTLDSIEAVKWVSDKLAELKTTENDTVFFNLYSEEPYSFKFLQKTELNSPIADSLFSLPQGALVGPFYDGKLIKVAKISERKMLSDSVYVRHIVISGQNIKTEQEANAKRFLFDSLFRQLDTLGADFAMLANAYSEDPANTDPMTGMKKGGDQGWIKMGQTPEAYNDAIFYQDKGRILRVFSDNNLYLIQVLKTTPSIPAIRVNYLTKSLLPSKATEDDILAKVSKWATDNNTKEKFIAAASRMSPLQVRDAYASENDYNVLGLPNSRQVVRWIYEAEKNMVSTPFRTGDDYVVGLLMDIRKKGAPTVDQVKQELEYFVRREKKVEILKKKVTDAKASNIDQLASKLSVGQLPFVNCIFANPNLNNVGNEPAVVGAISKLTVGKMTPPIEGNNGVYVAQADLVTPAPPTKDYSMYAGMIAQRALQRLGVGLKQSVVDQAKIEDNRSNFY